MPHEQSSHRSELEEKTSRTRLNNQPNEKFTPQEVVTALQLSAGIFSRAAATLGCSRSTIANYVDRYPAIKQALEEILEDRLDLGETVLLKAMMTESHPQQIRATEFYLRCKGGRRGYGGNRPISIEVPPVNTVADLAPAHAAIFETCTTGNITPAEAKTLFELLEMRRRLIVDIELEARLQAIEQHLVQTGITNVRS